MPYYVAPLPEVISDPGTAAVGPPFSFALNESLLADWTPSDETWFESFVTSDRVPVR